MTIIPICHPEGAVATEGSLVIGNRLFDAIRGFQKSTTILALAIY
jgi:hypothetical protein